MMTEPTSNRPSGTERQEQDILAPQLLWTSFAVVTGLAIGLGLFTFVYAKGASYMTNDPTACANCHVMNDQYAAWMKGSHRSAAVCNDCHTPAGFVPKYFTKAQNGFFHSLAFTTGWFPDNIEIHERNYEIARDSCTKCHGELTAGIQAVRGHGPGADCLHCHNEVGHKH